MSLNTHVRMLLLTSVLLTGVFTASSIVRPAHANGTLEISPSSQASLPMGSMVTYQVKVSGMDAFNFFDIYVQSDASVLDPQSITIVGNTLDANFSASMTELTNCVDGAGSGCGQNDGGGIAHEGAVSLNPGGIVAPISGILFTITYLVTATTDSATTSINILGLSSILFGSTVVVFTTANGSYGGVQAFDYSLSNNGPLDLLPGTSGSVAIFATLVAGTTQPVTLSCASISGPISCVSFSTNPVSPTGMSQLTISAASSAAIGAYSVTVTGNPLGATTTPTTVSVNVVKPTTTLVTCSPGAVMPNAAATCRAKVFDTSSTPTPPTGTITFTASGSGSFTPLTGTCTLVAGPGAPWSSCTVTYTPSLNGAQLISGTYGGDSTHLSSSGSFALNVITPQPHKGLLPQ